MISQAKFIESVKNKKNKLHNLYVKLFRRLCSFKSFRFDKFKNKPVENYSYLTICNWKSIDMVAASIYSLFLNSSNIPSRVIIVSDGSWNPSHGEEYFRKKGLIVECHSWVECSDHFLEIYPRLSEWANKQIWGKKMAAILYFAEKCPILFSDPDILWYGSPIDNDCENIRYKISLDNSHNYDDVCVKELSLDYLYDEPPINCGAIYMNMGIKDLPEAVFPIIDHESKSPGKFAEQTVFAMISHHFTNTWKMNEVTSEISDLLTPIYKSTIHYPNMIARHYLWRLKWIYWKDFVKLLFCNNYSVNS